jgi:plasmid rolling circle replication initiator protein Rep
LDFKRSLETGAMEFHRAHFCMNPLCPLCAMRRSEELYTHVSKVIDYFDENEDYRYVFITLTAKNVEGDGLKNALDGIHRAFNKFTKRKDFIGMSEGWIRGTEVTTNFKEKTFHHHLHLIVAVHKDYFDEFVCYISHDKLLGLWKSCLGVDYDTWVYIKKVRGKAEKSDGKKGTTITYRKAIAEITKYTAKPSDYIVMFKDREQFKKRTGIDLRNKAHAEELTDWAVLHLDAGLRGRRLMAFGGKFKEIHKKLNLEDKEKVKWDEVDVDFDGEKETGDYEILRYCWTYTIADYVLTEIFTPEQYYGTECCDTG